MKKVVVLLSTYNGEKYIREQIESICSQSYKHIKIFVRDDGSTDSTVSILRELEEDRKLEYYVGENFGVISSFIDLMEHAPESDLYAFCDQDDFWYKNKIERAVEALCECCAKIPLLYCTATELVDENLNALEKKSSIMNIRPSFGNALVQNVVIGCTAVFNNVARKRCLVKIPIYIEMHDSWLYLVCSAYGKVIFDNVPSVKYRQHSNNVLGDSALPLYCNIIKKCKTIIKNPRKNFRLKRAIELSELFTEDFETSFLLNDLLEYNTNLRSRIKLLFNRGIYMNRCDRDLIYRLSILFNHL
jgi:rhamnosyltransferase